MGPRASASFNLDAGLGGVAQRVCVVGPLPPPSGGMANQCEQLLRLMDAEVDVVMTLICSNAACRPAWLGRVPYVRALGRLLPYLWRLWVEAGRNDVMHIFANSGWAWHLVAWPALTIGRFRGIGIIVNYRGGLADPFFSSAPRYVLSSLAAANLRVTPSAYLHRVFAKHGLTAQTIPNIIDFSRFAFGVVREVGDAPHLVVTRNLEAIYDIAMALRAFRRVRSAFPRATLTVAGSGPDLHALQRQVADLDLTDCVTFPGRIDNADIPQLYAVADCMLNPSTVDNMPISILEAMASGVPLVSTDAGGIPDLVDSGRTGWLVPVGDDKAMADRAIALLRDRAARRAMCEAARSHVDAFAWPTVRAQWLAAYRSVARTRAPT